MPAASRLATAVVLIALLAPAAAPEEKNLVDNPSFSDRGDETVPKWKVRRVAGLTDFRVATGTLVAERKAGGTSSADSLLQTVYLPVQTEAIRVAIRAATEKALDARLFVNFQARDWKSLGGSVAFQLHGTRKMRLLERDLTLPPETHDVEIAIEMRGEGRLLVEEVSVVAIPADKVRDEARIAVLTASAKVPAPGEIRVPVPPPGETQCPVSLTFTAEPGGAITAAKLLPAEDGRQELALTVEAGVERISLSARVVVTERADFRNLPPELPLKHARFLDRRLLKWAQPAAGAAGGTSLEGVVDLRAAAEKIAKSAGATPAGAVGSFRAAGVPARLLTLCRLGQREPSFEYEVFSKELGWLRFSTVADDPRPAPCLKSILLLTAPAEAEVVLAALVAAEAKEVASLVLDRGGGPDLLSSLADAWGHYERAVEAGKPYAIDPEKLALKGKAKKLESRVDDILGIE